MPEPKSFQDLLLDEASELYDAEKQLVRALERLAASATASQIRAAIETYLEQTRSHVQRLDEVFALIGETPRDRRCSQMADILRDGNDRPRVGGARRANDAEALATIQRAAHYAIGAYGSLTASATTLGAEEAAGILRQTLSEEKTIDETLRTAVDAPGDIAVSEGPLVQEILRRTD